MYRCLAALHPAGTAAQEVLRVVQSAYRTDPELLAVWLASRRHSLAACSIASGAAAAVAAATARVSIKGYPRARSAFHDFLRRR